MEQSASVISLAACSGIDLPVVTRLVVVVAVYAMPIGPAHAESRMLSSVMSNDLLLAI